jgi:hypothetical protein
LVTQSILLLLTGSTLASCGIASSATSAGRATQRQLGRPVQEIPPASQVPAVGASVRPPPLSKSEPISPARDVETARRIARRFFAGYLRFLYGRVPAGEVPDVDGPLRRRLAHANTLITPAERSARPRVLGLVVVRAGPPASALATATIGSSPGRFRLTATLEPRDGGWIVVAVDG